jgi:hypothetical protein
MRVALLTTFGGSVQNLGAMVRELDRSLVPEIEAALGPSPEWYQPEK